jgi:hypothetical protein
MATYITLLHFTQRGIESIKEGPARIALGNASMGNHSSSPVSARAWHYNHSAPIGPSGWLA